MLSNIAKLAITAAAAAATAAAAVAVYKRCTAISPETPAAKIARLEADLAALARRWADADPSAREAISDEMQRVSWELLRERMLAGDFAAAS